MIFRISCLALVVAISWSPSLSIAQSAIEKHIWDREISLPPFSSTARAITGPLTFRKNSISFGGRDVPSRELGMAWRDWDGNGTKETAAVFELLEDSGPLINGNLLCGQDKAQWLVAWEDYQYGGIVRTAIYSSGLPPSDSSSSGLCGTYTYEWPTALD